MDQLLFACAKTRADTSAINTLLNGKIDWDHLIDLALVNQVAPLLYLNLRDKSIPPAAKASLQAIYRYNLIHNLTLDARQKKIFRLLAEEGIDFIALKGPVWAELIYGNIALRHSSDIDFLVRENELIKTRDLLINSGWKSIESLSEEYFLEQSQHLVLTHPEIGGVEIHWNLAPFNRCRIPPEILWRDIRSENIAGFQYKMFPPEILLLHALIMFFYKSFASLKLLVDVSEIILRYEQEIDWDKFIGLIKSYNMTKAFLLCLRLRRELLKVDSPEKLLIRLPKTSFINRFLITKFPYKLIISGNKGRRYFWRLLILDSPQELFPVIGPYFIPHRDKVVAAFNLRSADEITWRHYLWYPMMVFYGSFFAKKRQ
ncbi:nucleotidyltransferase family protein [Candidatus Saganbacteria bacterium]|nr:nucleotidyltransferase family protein [Candidatus Saganbacteria bacterium]